MLTKTKRPQQPAAAAQTIRVPIADIGRHPDQPREHFDQQELERLAKSIREHDLLQPVGLRVGSGETPYELLWGERRLRAAELAGHKDILAIVRAAGDCEAMLLIGEENLHRQDWNPIERAEYLAALTRSKKEGGQGMSHREVAKHFMRSPAWCSNSVRLLKLPEPFKARIISGEMSESKARLLLSHLDNETVLAAVDDDLASHPDLWKTREEFEQRLQLIAERLAAMNDPPAAAGKEGRAQRAAQSESHVEPAPSPRRVDELPSIDERRFKKFMAAVAPYRESLTDLESLRDLVEALIARMKGAAS